MTRFCGGAHPIDKQDSVKVIDLVLKRSREKPCRLDSHIIAVKCLRFDFDRKRSVNIGRYFRKTEAPFVAGLDFLAQTQHRI